MAFISCITVLSINLTNSDFNKIPDRTTRIIIKSAQKEIVPNNKKATEYGEIRRSIGESGVRLPPIPNINSPITFCPL